MRLHRNTIQFKLFVLITLIVILITITTGGFFYHTMSNTLRHNATKELSQILNQTNANLQSQFDIIDTTLTFFMSNPAIRENLEKEAPNYDLLSSAMKKVNIEKQLSYLLIYNYIWDTKLIKSVYIFDDKRSCYHIEHNNLTAKTSLQRNLNALARSSPSLESIQILPPSETDQTLYFVRNMKSEYSLDYIGTIIFAVDIAPLCKNYDAISQYKESLAFLSNKNQVILLHTDPAMLGRKTPAALTRYQDSKLTETSYKGQQFLSMSKVIKKYGFTSNVLLSTNQVYANLSNSLAGYAHVIILMLILCLMLSIFLSSQITKPIKTLMKNMENIRNGDFTNKMPTYRDLELRRLSEVFNRMTDEIQYLINDVYKKQLLLKKSELKALQSQVNPHFLFNVLDTISWLARSGESKRINEIVTPLAAYLRDSITIEGKEKITLRDELQHIKFYLSIQQSRFQDRFESKLHIADNSILDYYIPKYSLQPFVENAIIHGLEEKVANGLLVIRFDYAPDGIEIEIIDNGVGFHWDQHFLEESTMKNESHTSIGIYNSNKRIKLLYGDAYGVSIVSKIGEGTQVTVRIPLDKGDLNDAQDIDRR